MRPARGFSTRSRHGSPTESQNRVEARHAPLARQAHQSAVAVEPTTGEVHLRHHISPTGYYRGKKVVKGKDDE
jgi:ribosomal protein L32